MTTFGGERASFYQAMRAKEMMNEEDRRMQEQVLDGMRDALNRVERAMSETSGIHTGLLWVALRVTRIGKDLDEFHSLLEGEIALREAERDRAR